MSWTYWTRKAIATTELFLRRRDGEDFYVNSYWTPEEAQEYGRRLVANPTGRVDVGYGIVLEFSK